MPWILLELHGHEDRWTSLCRNDLTSQIWKKEKKMSKYNDKCKYLMQWFHKFFRGKFLSDYLKYTALAWRLVANSVSKHLKRQIWNVKLQRPINSIRLLNEFFFWFRRPVFFSATWKLVGNSVSKNNQIATIHSSIARV